MISLRKIIDYVERKTNRKSFLLADGDTAPYNGEAECSINTERAEKLGFEFTDLNDRIYALLDKYIEAVKL